MMRLYKRARYYDAAVGRWISEDPLGFGAGDTNVARYVGNDAAGFVDPFGLAEQQDSENQQGGTGGTEKLHLMDIPPMSWILEPATKIFTVELGNLLPGGSVIGMNFHLETDMKVREMLAFGGDAIPGEPKEGVLSSVLGNILNGVGLTPGSQSNQHTLNITMEGVIGAAGDAALDAVVGAVRGTEEYQAVEGLMKDYFDRKIKPFIKEYQWPAAGLGAALMALTPQWVQRLPTDTPVGDVRQTVQDFSIGGDLDGEELSDLPVVGPAFQWLIDHGMTPNVHYDVFPYGGTDSGPRVIFSPTIRTTQPIRLPGGATLEGNLQLPGFNIDTGGGGFNIQYMFEQTNIGGTIRF